MQESQYHPETYKTKVCRTEFDPIYCTVVFCPYYHYPGERRKDAMKNTHGD